MTNNIANSPVNTITADVIAAVAADLAGKDLNLGALFHQDYAAEFGDGSGRTIRVRVPGATAVSTRGVYSLEALELGSIEEQSVPVSLDVEAYSAVPLARGHLDLSLRDYGKQVLLPQTRAVVQYAERAVAQALTSHDADETISEAYDALNPRAVIVKARAKLRDAGVPDSAEIFAVTGAGAYADLIMAQVLDENGAVAGTDVRVHESTRLPSGSIFVGIKEAVALAVRAPSVPDGAPFGASVQTDDYAATVIRAFNPAIGADQSTVSAFVGASAMPLAVDNEDGTVDLIDGAAMVHIDTTLANGDD